ncbi:hypothetical protein [Pseudomonas alkylphenolica]|nr:hypothetical protein [Pseudomonas alkylphenolica]
MKNSDMENSSSIPDAQTPPDYHRCLPVELHSQADAFIQHLHELPNRSPVECPRCGHPRFRLEAHRNLRLPYYRCIACNKGFNCLTKHPFSRYGLAHLWSAYAHYLLAGWSIYASAKALGVCHTTTWRWIKPCRAVMAKEFPALYHWWSARQDRTELEPPAHIAAQAQAFLGGLEHVLTTRQAVCPKCGSPDMRRVDERRPTFVCPGCWTTVSLIKGTLLCRLNYPEHWLGFAQGLINGESIVDLQRRTGLSESACTRWKERFLQMIEQQGHAELVQWIAWLRSRRVKEVIDYVRDGGKMEPVAGSRHAVGPKTGFGHSPALKAKHRV